MHQAHRTCSDLKNAFEENPDKALGDSAVRFVGVYASGNPLQQGLQTPKAFQVIQQLRRNTMEAAQVREPNPSGYRG